MTSQSAVNRVKRLLGAKKAGHTGTLDPMASGVLPVMVGNAVKAGEYMLRSVKHYDAVLCLGMTTDTQDATGTVLTRCTQLPPPEQVLECLDRFRGEGMQIPPMYSALKVGGKKLVDLARRGVEVERAPRPITIYRLDGVPLGAGEYRLSVTCSKGTYIRTLCADIGAVLGCGGILRALCRTEASGFTLDDAVTLEELEALSVQEREARLIAVEQVFSEYPAVVLPPFFARLARCGQPIYQKKIGTNYPVGSGVRLSDAEGFFAFARAQDSEQGSVLRPEKQFVNH